MMPYDAKVDEWGKGGDPSMGSFEADLICGRFLSRNPGI